MDNCEMDRISKLLMASKYQMLVYEALLSFKYKWYDFLNPFSVFRLSKHITDSIRTWDE